MSEDSLVADIPDSSMDDAVDSIPSSAEIFIKSNHIKVEAQSDLNSKVCFIFKTRQT